jgi:CelD/BcsL family acetyltransferase involved in cellulose biosynthesis
MTSVREINRPEELRSIAPLWRELVAQTPTASFFHTVEWLELWWKHFGSGKRLRVLVVEHDDGTQGILPLAVHSVRRGEPFRALAYPLDAWGFYYSPIGPHPHATLAAGLEHVQNTKRDWHFVELAFVDSWTDRGLTGTTLGDAGFAANCQEAYHCGVIDLAAYGSWDAYWAARSKVRRKDVKKKEKRLAERGEVSFLRHRVTPADGPDADPRLDLYDQCVEISRKSWQGTATIGNSLCRGPAAAFYRECYLLAVRLGCAELNLVLVDGQPVGYDFGFHYQGKVAILKTGYDPAYREGVGTILLAREIADSFARGDHTFDLGPEFMGYKRSWISRIVPVHRYTYFPRYSLGAQAIRAKRAIVSWWRNRATIDGDDNDLTEDSTEAAQAATGGDQTGANTARETAT